MSKKDNLFTTIETRTEVVKKKKENEKKSGRTTGSTKPLKFEASDGDSILKAHIIEKINEADLTYSDLYDYLTEKVYDGDKEKGRNKATNTIQGLRTRPSMMDTTFYLLCDMLGYDIVLMPKEEATNKTEEEDEEE